jgi:hypothetical protein
VLFGKDFWLKIRKFTDVALFAQTLVFFTHIEKKSGIE